MSWIWYVSGTWQSYLVIINFSCGNDSSHSPPSSCWRSSINSRTQMCMLADHFLSFASFWNPYSRDLAKLKREWKTWTQNWQLSTVINYIHKEAISTRLISSWSSEGEYCSLHTQMLHVQGKYFSCWHTVMDVIVLTSLRSWQRSIP